MNDQTLLKEYVAHGSEAAFRELVERHVDLVYSAARRRLQDPHLAEDVVQQVFALLARKAATLGESVIIPGWLYRAALHAASQTLRSESRRRHREHQCPSPMNASEVEPDWQAIEPSLDEAMASLPTSDRDAVVLRYFERKNLLDVGAALGISEDAAQKRLTRAMEKLRQFFARRGRAVTAAGLTAALATGAVQAAPTALAGAVSAAVLAGSVVPAAGLASFALMSSLPLKPLIVTVASVAAVVLVTVDRVQINRLERAAQELRARAHSAEQSARLAEERLREMQHAAENDPRTAELMRLRGELASLQRSQAQLTAANQRLRQSQPAPAPPAAPPEDDALAKSAEYRMGIAKLNYAKAWALALILSAKSENDGRLPESLDQAAGHFVDPSHIGDEAIQSPELASLQMEQFEVMYRGPWQDITHPERTIILREREPVPNDAGTGLIRAYGFADGHTEIHLAPDGDFGPWEQERLLPPADTKSEPEP